MLAAAIGDASTRGAELFVSAELAVTGYPPEDLLHKRHFLDDARQAIAELAPLSTNTACIIGFPEADGDRVYNAAAVLAGGRHVATYRKIHLPNYGVFVEHRVGPGNFLLEVGDKRIGNVTEAALLAIGLHPGEMAELAVYRNTKHLRIAAGEICVAVAESGDLRGADEGEVKRIEEQHHILAAVLGESDLLELLIHNRCGGEIGGRQTDEPGHGEERSGNGKRRQPIGDEAAGSIRARTKSVRLSVTTFTTYHGSGAGCGRITP
jgi:hypothetical protein